MPLRPASLIPLLALGACIVARRVQVVEVERTADSVQVRTPVKAHMLDGSTVVYPNGVLVAAGRLTGAGTRYDLALDNPAEVTGLPLDSLIGLESFRTDVDEGATVALSAAATLGAIGLGVGIACALDPKCFGSCPTYYSDSAGTAVLEAEGFSYSIAPLFESRDVDRLRARAGADGMLRLEVRNEAFETHFINHLELLEAAHREDEVVAPDPQGQVAAVAGQGAARVARDRAGRDVAAALARADGQTYATAPAVLASVSETDLDDAIELLFDVAPSRDSVALVLRLRNSLLNTVLLYDLMLGDPGARSLDWQAEHLSRVGEALELGSWYASRMGLGIEVWRDSGWVQVARVKDTGPVAWKDVAVPLPAGNAPELRVRLRFPADNWRIDRVALAESVRRPELRRLGPPRITSSSGGAETAATTAVATPDGRYLRTGPTHTFFATWDAGPEPAGARTFLLASQGYYIEWVRQGWITAARDTMLFRPGDASLLRAVERWRQVQDTLEQRFFATRVPVR